MAATFVISCPECQKKFKGREELQGKKIRCPKCGHAFVVETMAQDKVESAQEKAPPVKAKARAVKAPAAPAKVEEAPPIALSPPPAPPPKPPEDDDGESNPYGVTTLDMAPRCPSCTEKLPSEDTLVCPSCGYNTQTRTFGKTIKTIEHTGGERFKWLLPGLLCFLGILLLYLIAVFYSGALPEILGGDHWTVSEAMRLWITWMLLGVMWGLGRFAHKRLIFEPKPPEKVKG
jgi:DNA-directed RNA polymerase subunit RPC12/RpoP